MVLARTIVSFLRAIGGSLSRLAAERRAAIAPIFALCLPLILGLVGGAADYATALSRHARLQNVLDAAALAATRQITALSTQAQAAATIRGYLNAHLDFASGVAFDVQINTATRSLKVTATYSYQTVLLPIMGIKTVPLAAMSASQLGRSYLELALVLDNSGSMAGSRITAARLAATDLMRKVLDMAYTQGDVQVALVPFASMVNVGTGNASASWMDTGGLSPIHSENFSTSANRFTLFKQMRGVSWGGCVETRPSPHDVTDSKPVSGTPATLFVPSFAPDEPDEGTWYGFYNSYIDDACTGQSSSASAIQRQERVCKYAGATPDVSLANGTRRGPNQLCDSNPIVPLNYNAATLAAAIAAMPAYGGTNLVEAVTWGWRVLSPDPPFTEGRAYSDPQNRKIMVLMTDGSNDIIGISNMNGSFYSSFGYAVAGRLGTTSSNRNTLIAKMNEKTLLACANAKAAGIQIYTVAFYVTDATALSILSQCASDPSMALVANSETGLTDAFSEIGNQIKRLRLTD